VVKKGISLDKEIRLSIVEQAKGTSEDFLITVRCDGLENLSKRWINAIKLDLGDISDDNYQALNQSLCLERGDVIFLGLSPQTFSVRLV
jgi:hypothetical protein